MPLTACSHYKWEYAENDRGCRSCPGTSRAVCKEITPITKQAVKATLEELPEFLTHADDVVRKAARYRMRECLEEEGAFLAHEDWPMRILARYRMENLS